MVIVCHFIAMSLMATWHLHLVLEKIRGGGSELADLDVLLPVSIRRCWPSFISQAVIGFGGHLLSFVGGHLCLWVVVFIFWLVVVMGRSWVVIGVRCRVVVAVGGVVGLCLWLVEERSDVTSCDISVMFKLAREITCTISHDFLAVYTQSWSNLSRGEIQPSGLVSVLLSSGEAHLPTSTSENHPSLAGITGGQ